MLYDEPLGAVDCAPKFQAHMSAFSWPLASLYQAFKFGSLMDSSNSCDITEIMASMGGSLLGLLPNCTEQPDWVPASPTNAYLMLEPLRVPYVCQPQYWERNPELSPTPGAVRTKYTALVSVGIACEVRAFETMLAILESFSKFPKLLVETVLPANETKPDTFPLASPYVELMFSYGVPPILLAQVLKIPDAAGSCDQSPYQMK